MLYKFQLVLLSTILGSSLARPAYPGAGHGAYNPAFYNGGYNSAYDGATFDPHPRYNFDYRVSEPRTGDFKNHQESRDGDAVRGTYSVAEPDGSLLTVRYTADDAHGYTAVVERSGHGGTIVQNFPGAAPLPVAPLAPVATHSFPAVSPPVPYTPLPAPVPAPLPSRHYGAAHFGHGTSSTSFHGPHAAYSYTN